MSVGAQYKTIFFSMKLKFAMQLSHINSVKTVAQSRNRFTTRTNQ